MVRTFSRVHKGFEKCLVERKAGYENENIIDGEIRFFAELSRISVSKKADELFNGNILIYIRWKIFYSRNIVQTFHPPQKEEEGGEGEREKRLKLLTRMCLFVFHVVIVDDGIVK